MVLRSDRRQDVATQFVCGGDIPSGKEFFNYYKEDAQDNKQACMAGIRDQWEFSDLNHFKIYRTVLEKCND